MDVVTTSLEALIQRVTNPQNQKADIAATEAFCVMLSKETDGPAIATKLLATQIQSSNECESLQALTLLDTCMRRCGPTFHAEVGKFRFLNEMIKLVSPKYLGEKTPSPVREQVLSLLKTWITEYPRELKIKEAYEMLRKQGVVKDEAIQVSPNSTTKPAKNNIFEDEEKSRLLQKLLQSKNPDDLHAANRLIRTMFKEDEKRVQMNSQRIMELESVHNNVKLLSDMLDSYNPSQTSSEDLDLIKELYDACGRLKPVILRLANETQDNEEMLAEVLAASDALVEVHEKYASVVILDRTSNSNNGLSLLDFSTPAEVLSPINPENNKENNGNPIQPSSHKKSDMEALRDIFSSLENSNSNSIPISPDSSLLMLDECIMQPTILSTSKKEKAAKAPDVDSKTRALEDLNELGESLLRETLSSTSLNGHLSKFSKSASRVPMNSIAKGMVHEEKSEPETNNQMSADIWQKLASINEPSEPNSHVDKLFNADVEEKDDPILQITNGPEVKSLADINVTLENITPGATPALTVIEEKNGISVILNKAKDGPRADVSVIVVTTVSKNSKPLSNYLFQAVISKGCKCRLQPPSGTDLPAHNAFLPPSAITQIMLISNPNKEPLSLKFMLSYTMDDETVTEMGEVDHWLNT